MYFKVIPMQISNVTSAFWPILHFASIVISPDVIINGHYYVLPQSYEKAVFLVRISHFLDFFLRIKTFGLRIMIRTLNMASDQGS